jgi:hypothetical protein
VHLRLGNGMAPFDECGAICDQADLIILTYYKNIFHLHKGHGKFTKFLKKYNEKKLFICSMPVLGAQLTFFAISVQIYAGFASLALVFVPFANAVLFKHSTLYCC